MDGALRDLKHAARLLARAPGFTAVAVLSLGLGIGANTTIFTWVNGVLLHPLQGVSEADRLVVVTATDPREAFISLSYPDYLDYAASGALAGLVVQDERPLSLGHGGQADRIWALVVSENYFDVLGVRPALGGGFSADSGPAVVISHGLWQRRFGGDPAIVGRSVTLNTVPVTVIGVAPRDFVGSVVGLSLDAWVPVTLVPRLGVGTSLENRGNRWLQALGRLKAGSDPSQAQAELNVVARRLAAAYPQDRNVGVAVYRFSNAPTGATRLLGPVLRVLAAVVAVVLLIACANVASLLLTRGAARRREMAIRVSLGAGRWRLARQMLIESLLLAFLGGAAAVVIAAWGSGLLWAFAPATDLPVSLRTALDLRALGFTMLVAALSAVLFGLAPAWQASREDPSLALRAEAATSSGGRRRARVRASLVVGQVALSLLLLVGAGLLLRSLHHARSASPGFNPRGVLIASVDLVGNGYSPAAGRTFYRDALARIRALPGVRAASLTRRAPLGIGGSSSSTLVVEGYEAPADRPAWAFTHSVGPDYFRTMETALASGRDFGAGDTALAPRVAIVNETMASRYWPGRDAVGGRLHFGTGDWMTVVGVSRDARYRQLNEPPAPQLFLPIDQAYRAQATLLVRAEEQPARLAPAVLAQVRALDPALPVFAVGTLEQHVQAASFQQRLGGWLLAGFGALALALAVVGLYGVLAYSVAQRTREIGIRMALGSARAAIFGLVLREGLKLSVLGLAAGLVGAGLAARALSSLLLGVRPLDPVTFAAVAALLVVVALLACLAPARRAARVDPIVALRYE
ncbi:MAG TPA: ABC transporter permease [Vicinamibacteria bacterium]|nr:ABC transporter permease [Vicinamibacteria bacterium]